MEKDILKEIRTSLVKHFLDIVILCKLKKTASLCGYDFIKFIHETQDILVSPGTVYSVLYALERKEWVRGEWKEGKRVYSLSGKGEGVINTIIEAREELLRQMKSLIEC
jgi:DNA-binding PadR family transcriptional regulator